MVTTYDGEKKAPEITIEATSVEVDGEQTEACELKIVSAPQTPGKASDWRFGHFVGNPEAVRGQTVTFQVQLKASQAVAFDSAHIYIYDGVNMTPTTLERVTAEWQTFSVQQTIDSQAPVFEVWIRLLFDTGTIRLAGDEMTDEKAAADGESLYMTAAVEVGDS